MEFAISQWLIMSYDVEIREMLEIEFVLGKWMCIDFNNTMMRCDAMQISFLNKFERMEVGCGLMLGCVSPFKN